MVLISHSCLNCSIVCVVVAGETKLYTSDLFKQLFTVVKYLHVSHIWIKVTIFSFYSYCIAVSFPYI